MKITKTRNNHAVAAWKRNGGVHKDQHKRNDPHTKRRDKSYKGER